MTVGQFIRELEKFPPHYEVMRETGDHEAFRLTHIERADPEWVTMPDGVKEGVLVS